MLVQVRRVADKSIEFARSLGGLFLFFVAVVFQLLVAELARAADPMLPTLPTEFGAQALITSVTGATKTYIIMGMLAVLLIGLGIAIVKGIGRRGKGAVKSV